jgi:hypothetical protein
LGLEHVTDLMQVLVSRSSTNEELFIICLHLGKLSTLVLLFLVTLFFFKLASLNLAQLTRVGGLLHLNELLLFSAAMNLGFDNSSSEFNLSGFGGLRWAVHQDF